MTDICTKRQERNGFLDVIKTIATIFIVFHLFQQILGIQFSVINFWRGSFYFGRLVELFFLISGFLMTPYISKIVGGLSFNSFFTRRYLRLIPIVAISTVMDSIISSVLNYKSFVENPLKIILETASVALGIHGTINSEVAFANNPMWYISVLLWCYVVFYFVFALYKRLSVKKPTVCLLFSFFMIMIGCIILMLYLDIPFFNESVGRGFVSFFSGVATGVVLDRVSLSKKILVPILIFITVLSFIPIRYFYILSHMRETILYVIMFCYVPLLILSKTDRITKLFNRPIWSFMAKISFHAFCFHIPIIGLFNLLFSSETSRARIYSNAVLSMIICTVFIYAFSIMTYFAVEKPLSLRLKARIQQTKELIRN